MFVFVTTCYAYTLQSIISRVLGLLGVWPRVIDPVRHVLRPIRPAFDAGASATNLLLIAPIVESLVVIAIVELLRRLGFRASVQITVSVFVSCLLHSIQHLFWGFVVIPTFLLGVIGYIYWRRISFWSGLQVIIALHFCINAIAFLTVLTGRG